MSRMNSLSERTPSIQAIDLGNSELLCCPSHQTSRRCMQNDLRRWSRDPEAAFGAKLTRHHPPGASARLRRPFLSCQASLLQRLRRVQHRTTRSRTVLCARDRRYHGLMQCLHRSVSFTHARGSQRQVTVSGPAQRAGISIGRIDTHADVAAASLTAASAPC